MMGRCLRALLVANVVACGSFGTAPPPPGENDASTPANEAGVPDDGGTSPGTTDGGGSCTPRPTFEDPFERPPAQLTQRYAEKKEENGSLAIATGTPLMGSALAVTLNAGTTDGYATLRRDLSPASCPLVVSLQLYTPAFPTGSGAKTTLVRVQFPTGQLELVMNGQGKLEIVDDPDDASSVHYPMPLMVTINERTSIKLTMDTTKRSVVCDLHQGGTTQTSMVSFKTPYQDAMNVHIGAYDFDSVASLTYYIDNLVIE